MPDSSPALAQAAPAQNVTLQIVQIVLFNFACYLTIGLPLAVLPPWVHNELGFGTVLAGVAISSHYLATVLTRPLAGRIADTRGPRYAVLLGLLACTISGAGLLLASLLQALPALSLCALIGGRLFLGLAESLITIGVMTWGIGRVGHGHTAKVISWNGMSSYGAMALGAPLGVLLQDAFGLSALAVTMCLIGAASFWLARRYAPVPLQPGERLPFATVFTRILPFGLVLALGSTGFGAIATFITLFYASRHWPHAALALTMFGTFFILARLLFSASIPRLGGYRVAMSCFAVEALGLTLLWYANAPAVALAGAALSGFGFALVFPSLGVEAVHGIAPANRGTALGAYALFFDLALGITGPLAGLIANRFDYAAVYLCAAAAAVLSLAATAWLRLRAAGTDARI